MHVLPEDSSLPTLVLKSPFKRLPDCAGSRLDSSSAWCSVGEVFNRTAPDMNSPQLDYRGKTRAGSTIFRALPLVVCGLKVGAAILTWDGGGGDDLWENPLNWSGDVVPGPTDEVVINAPGEFTVTNSAGGTIRGLQCANHLALAAGTFQVTSGASLIQGQLFVMGNPTVSAIGAGTALTLAGVIRADGASFEASDGATLSIPSLQSYAKGSGCAAVIWEANGGDSVLEISGLTNVTGADCASLAVRATGGGEVRLSGLTTVSEGTIGFRSEGAGSLISLPALWQSLAANRDVSFEARDDGTISMPAFRGGRRITVALSSGGLLPAAQLEELRGFSVTGMGIEFSALTNLALGNVTVSGGGVVTLPNLVAHIEPTGCATHNWQASGASSVLDLPGLVVLSGPDCGWLNLQATSGGTIRAPQITSVEEGTVNFLADGAGSFIDLERLAGKTPAIRGVSFEARNQGRIGMSEFTGGPAVTVTLRTAGELPVAGLEQLKGFTVQGMTVTFPALTQLSGGDALASDGAIVSVPNLVSHDADAGCPVSSWEASGIGSLLDFSNLAMLAGPGCGWLNVRATGGGTFDLGALEKITEGTLYFLADGDGSLLELSSLDEALAMVRPVSFEVRNNGTIAFPLLKGGPTVTVSIKSGGSLAATQLNVLKGLTVSGTSLTLPGITNLFSGNLTVDQGGTLSLPSIFNYHSDRCSVTEWTALGPGSVLDLSSLRYLEGSDCGNLEILAADGGQVRLDQLATIPLGSIMVRASDPNSQVDLRALTLFMNLTGRSQLTTANGGTLHLNADPLILSGVAVEFSAGTPGLPETTLDGTNLWLRAVPWRSYVLEVRETSAPENPWVMLDRVPLTTEFEAVGTRARAGLEFRAAEFVADPFALELTPVAGDGVAVVLYAPMGGDFEFMAKTDLSPSGAWETLQTVTMTNTFRIFPNEPIGTPFRFFSVHGIE